MIDKEISDSQMLMDINNTIEYLREIYLDGPFHSKVIRKMLTDLTRDAEYLQKNLQIKPCPFCGGTPELIIDQYGCFFQCPSCGGRVERSCNESAAIKFWNNRAEIDND